MNLHHNFAMIGVLLLSVAAWAQHAGEGLSIHNLNGQTCTACHAARSSSPPEEPPENAGNKTLSWDSDLLTRTFQTYDVAVPSGNPAAPVLNESQVRMSSLLCASCHDGVSTLSMSGTASFRSRSSTNASKGLASEHPIDVPYDPVKDPSLAALTVVTLQVKLFGQTNRVQCATCHNVHDNSDPKLLRAPNTNSSLCIACHL